MRVPSWLVGPVGGPLDEVGVCLAICGEELDPDAITAILGCAPTSSHRRGDRRGARSPGFETGAWLFQIRGAAPVSADDLVTDLLNQLPHDAATWATLAEAYDLQLRFGIHMEGWNRGFGLCAANVERIARMRVRLAFDIYAYGQEGTSAERVQ
jgi:hypothetical protein